MIKRGFTLVEVLLVLVILGITATVAVPAFGRLTARDEAAESSRELLELLRKVRGTAIDRGVATTLTLDPGTGRYWVSAGSKDGREDLAAGTLSLTTQLTLATRAPRVRWTFAPTGAAYGDSVFVRGPSGLAVVVGADPWTGELYARTW